MADIVKNSGYKPDDFFIYAMSGTDDFAYTAFKEQIMAMGGVKDGTFKFADNEKDGNLAFRKCEVTAMMDMLQMNIPITGCCFSGIKMEVYCYGEKQEKS